jgi:A/G-specific adenine glycosylase
VRARHRAVPHYHIAVGVVQHGDRILITRRQNAGLLGGLWEFPGGKVEDGEAPDDTCRREIREEVNLDVSVTGYLTHVDHAYSHFKIGVDIYTCEYQAGEVKLNGPADHKWILVDEIDDYPFPGANHKFIPLVKEKLKRQG